MAHNYVSYQESGYFSSLIVDYLNEKEELKPLYNKFPKLENFGAQILEKQQNFRLQHRITLYEVLLRQNASLNLSEATQTNISELKKKHTFTVTTGHQLNLFTGPVYFLYKIVSTINLCEELKSEYPDHHFVPVFWMATEDHDFEEISSFTVDHLKFKWSKRASGPVGRLSTEGLSSVFKHFSDHLGVGRCSDELRKLFEAAYLKHQNLAEATRYLVNELFGTKGLVIIDGDDINLKTLFAPVIKKELMDQVSKKATETSFLTLNKYHIQVNPREINLFYIDDKFRERIVYDQYVFKVLNTDIQFSKEEILKELEIHPERFSPNVILRPVYQEVVLPNLCYIGGGGELAYWLELKNTFKVMEVSFPMLLLRNSVLLVSEKQNKKWKKAGLNAKDFFLKVQQLESVLVHRYSDNMFDFQNQKFFLEKQFDELRLLAAKTDVSFVGAVNAQERKQIKGLEQLEKRLLKAEKRLYKEKLQRMIALRQELFPNQNLQEREANFAQFYKEYGSDFIEKLFQKLDPLHQRFDVIVL